MIRSSLAVVVSLTQSANRLPNTTPALPFSTRTPCIRVVGLLGDSGPPLELRALPNVPGRSNSEFAVEGRDEIEVAWDELLPRRFPAAVSLSLNFHVFIASLLVDPALCRAGPAVCWILDKADDSLVPWPDELVEVEKSEDGFRPDPAIHEDDAEVDVDVREALDSPRGRVWNTMGGAWW
jgi:hypothetical protein